MPFSLSLTLLLSVTIAGIAPVPQPPGSVRVATFNVKELSRAKLDEVDAAGHGTNPQLQAAAAVIQSVRPAVLLLNEIDFDAERQNARLFQERYLAVPQGDRTPIAFPNIVFEPVNTGLPTPFDLNHDGQTGGPDDALGFGRYPGQYGMAVYSTLPVERAAVRTFQNFLWRDLPNSVLPDGRDGGPQWYAADEVSRLRLSSKSHWDVPVRLDDGTPTGRTVHLLASHPTPPVFDGPENRNGRRNRDELKFWADYLTGGDAAAALTDDAGHAGGLPAEAAFVVLEQRNVKRSTMRRSGFREQEIKERGRCCQRIFGNGSPQQLTLGRAGGRSPNGSASRRTRCRI